jgi:hypothetical protein
MVMKNHQNTLKRTLRQKKNYPNVRQKTLWRPLIELFTIMVSTGRKGDEIHVKGPELILMAFSDLTIDQTENISPKIDYT